MFDTHCHLNFSRFWERVDAVVADAKAQGVTHILVPGTDGVSSQKAVEIVSQYENVYAAVGIHPHHVHEFVVPNFAKAFATSDVASLGERGSWFRDLESASKQGVIARTPTLRRRTWQSLAYASSHSREIPRFARNDKINHSSLAEIEKLLQHKKVVAVGEVGVDRHPYRVTKYEEYAVDEKFIALQKELLKRQIGFALQYDKSLILHNREAKQDLFAVLQECWDDRLRGRTVFHCCEPDEDLLLFAQEHDIFIGVDGDITYTPAKQEFIKKVPLEKLVLETDAPFLLPEPLRSKKQFPNEPKNLRLIGEFVAKILQVPFDKLAEVTFENSCHLLALKGKG